MTKAKTMKQQRNKYTQQSRRWVIKIGSALITAGGKGLDAKLINAWVEQIAELRKQGLEILLVSSGAVAEGMQRLGISVRPHSLHELQAAAAVGQMGLVQTYESAFQKFNIHTAQVLLTHHDLANRTGYLNARSTLQTLLDLKVIPIINENDTVATDEIRGDNDTLAASVANLVQAELLCILTDQDGMFEEDPSSNAHAKMISSANAGDSKLEAMAQGGKISNVGTGGMLAKVRSAKRAARSGAATIIANGRTANILQKIRLGEEMGTMILPSKNSIAARKQWLVSQLKAKGELILDQGAVNVLLQQGRSLLSVGVLEVNGSFQRGELVSCRDQQGNEVARGLVNYNDEEARRIKGQGSQTFEDILGYIDEPELIHRDNLVLL